MLRLILFALSFAMSCPIGAVAQTATEQDMAESAMRSLIGRKDEERRAELIATLRAQVELNAATDPDTDFLATLVFNPGLPEFEVANFVEEFDLEVVRMEIKVPVGDKGMVRTASIGAYDIHRIDANLGRRLVMAIAFFRNTILDEVPHETSQARQDELQRAAFTPMNVYKADVIASGSKLKRVLDHSARVVLIRTVPKERGSREIEYLREIMSKYEEAFRANRQPH